MAKERMSGGEHAVEDKAALLTWNLVPENAAWFTLLVNRTSIIVTKALPGIPWTHNSLDTPQRE
jgi:hypothetical protein